MKQPGGPLRRVRPPTQGENGDPGYCKSRVLVLVVSNDPDLFPLCPRRRPSRRKRRTSSGSPVNRRKGPGGIMPVLHPGGQRPFAIDLRGASTNSGPKTASSISRVTPPGGESAASDRSDQARSIPPHPVGPASIINSILPSKSAITWLLLVGLGRPEVLALGAATGCPVWRNNSWATGWAGKRTAP